MARTLKFLNSVMLLVGVMLIASCADRPEPLGFERAQMDHLTWPPFEGIKAPPHAEQVVSAVIDSKGGYIVAPPAVGMGQPFGYLLYIPAGTVKKPTTFTMKVLAGEHYAVDLTATQTDKNGNVINVGDDLRKNPVIVMSVKDTPSPKDPRTMVIIYEPDDGSTPIKQPSFEDKQNGYVFGVLSHFSRYSGAYN